MDLGRIGIWSSALGADQPRSREAAAELEELGYGTIWIGGSPPVDAGARLLAATSHITVATGILNIWEHRAADVAAQHAEVTAKHPGRFVLGLGVSHSAIVPNYAKPYTAMRTYLDELDAAGQPAAERVLAALGPRMLELSARRAAGAHPYLVTPEHTARAREILGADPVLAPELKVVLAIDTATGREIARSHLQFYFQLPNYVNSLRRLGFTDDDLSDGGSDRLVDATVAIGDEDVVSARLKQHFDAGADHVCIQVVGEMAPGSDVRTAGRQLTPVGWRRLAGLNQTVS
jgi:probable F420-dependent oxidoreductase